MTNKAEALVAKAAPNIIKGKTEREMARNAKVVAKRKSSPKSESVGKDEKMRIDILSLFPEYFRGPFDESMIKRAREARDSGYSTC